ncbi:DUF4935 domain-containing protein [Cellulomonas hominis]|uniref:PIN like domain-containing protein n=1 Tax=Cellulomonas hominis TaxID=156981 RepID=A0A7W8SGV8_9CELL|nr:PIN-like domain-containing protein [Cellulomonas hominis]MBB5474793.1 hypothetical protein [Cellulomonas hominis]NKY05802.1 DUF4935 domain-containing protein [Cellulomonas hominis]
MSPLLPEPTPAADPADIFDTALIVLDTSVLLSLYRTTKATRDSWFEVLEKVRDRLVMPHQVAVEFERNAPRSRDELRGLYAEVESRISALSKAPGSVFTASKLHSHRRDALKATIDKRVADLLADVQQDRAGDTALIEGDADPVLDAVTALFADRVLPAPAPDIMRSRVLDFVSYRRPSEIPPGWRDDKPTPTAAAGDYLLWAEVLEHAASLRMPVLLVTEDVKDDWWLKKDGAMTAQPQLVAELYRASGQPYAQMLAPEFLKLGQEQLDLAADAAAVEETAQASEPRWTAYEDALAASRDGRSTIAYVPGSAGALNGIDPDVLRGMMANHDRVIQAQLHEFLRSRDEALRLGLDRIDDGAARELAESLARVQRSFAAVAPVVPTLGALTGTTEAARTLRDSAKVQELAEFVRSPTADAARRVQAEQPRNGQS